MRKTAIVCLLCVLLSLGLMLYAFVEPPDSAPARAPVYAQFVADDIGATAMQQKQGMLEAATELAVELKTYTAEQNVAQMEQMHLFLEEARKSEARGIVLSPCGGDARDEALRAAEAMGVPLVCLWEDASFQQILFVSDDAALGRALASAVRQACGDQEPIALFALSDAQSEERLAGALEVLSGPYTLYRGELEALSLPRGTAMLSLSPELTRGIALTLGGEGNLWGVDPGEDRVTFLEQGLVRALGMKMPYAEGYLALKALHESASSGRKAGAIPCPVRVIDRETMYDSENVKILFPLLQ